MRACDLCVKDGIIMEAIYSCKYCGQDMCIGHYSLYEGDKLCRDCLDKNVSSIAEKKISQVEQVAEDGVTLLKEYSEGNIGSVEANARARFLLSSLASAIGEKYKNIGTDKEKMRKWVHEAHDEESLHAWSIKDFETDFGEGASNLVKEILLEEGLYNEYSWIWNLVEVE